VAGVAKGLPVRAIPEHGLVTLVGDDVVKVSGCYHQPLALALSTEWMLGQVGLACLLPLVAVPALSAGLTLPLAALGLGTLADVRMVIAVARVAGQHIAALGIAWFLRPQRHTLPTSNHLAADCQAGNEHQHHPHRVKVSHGGLPRLAAFDLGVHLVGTRVQQLDGLVFEIPHITVVAQVSLIGINAFARD